MNTLQIEIQEERIALLLRMLKNWRYPKTSRQIRIEINELTNQEWALTTIERDLANLYGRGLVGREWKKTEDSRGCMRDGLYWKLKK